MKMVLEARRMGSGKRDDTDSSKTLDILLNF